ncbi:MAG: heme-binding protein [Desulfuromonadales bacterium]|nr:heme-binding protein [Desulfuromonadales bacterium]
MAYKEPAYRVIRTYPAFELRQYDTYVAAKTQVAGAFDEVGNQAFRNLGTNSRSIRKPDGT